LVFFVGKCLVRAHAIVLDAPSIEHGAGLKQRCKQRFRHSALWSKRTKLDHAVDPTWIFDGWFDLD
jgi:hypothetical protein